MSDPSSAEADQRHERLADFIRHNQPAIIEEWIAFARTRSPASDGMSKLALKDHIVDILKFVASDLESPQTAAEQIEKSHGIDNGEGSLRNSAAEIHAALRLSDGFDIDQMVSEYRALRASVVKQWIAHHNSLASTDLEDLTRFNEAIDQAVTESVAHYTKTINDSRNLFLGILGHDLRNPVAAASMAAQWMVRSGPSDPKHADVVSELVLTTDRASRIVEDLFDLTRSSFGTDIPIKKSQTDLAALCQAIADELRRIHERQTITVTQDGDSTGLFDAARMGQVISNLMSNAIQYSDGSCPVTVTISGNDTRTLSVSIHNLGAPIPAESQKTIFQSWMRGQVQDTGEHSHLGLGLYIAKLIVEAHGGKIVVASEEATGTSFTIQLPRA